jgi:uncharacterized protein (TIGR00299 family) protein
VTLAYFDCFSGICGDMILGALIDLGVPIKQLEEDLQKLPLNGYDLKVKTVQRNHIRATDVAVVIEEQHHHRSYKDIVHLIDSSSLSDPIKTTSKDIFLKLAKAEGKIHRVPLEHVHFHEVGAVDSIIDIVGAAICLQHLAIQEIVCSPLPLGHGFVTCSHGKIPVPAPATIELLKDVPVYATDREQELVTPTGAAIITTVAKRFGRIPLMKIHRIGYGSGKTPSKYPNVLRVFLGESLDQEAAEFFGSFLLFSKP